MKKIGETTVDVIENPAVEQLKLCARGQHNPIFETSQGKLCLTCREKWPKLREPLSSAPHSAPRTKSAPSMMASSPATAVLGRDGRVG